MSDQSDTTPTPAPDAAVEVNEPKGDVNVNTGAGDTPSTDQGDKAESGEQQGGDTSTEG